MSVKGRAGRGSLSIGLPRERAAINDIRPVDEPDAESELWRARWSAIGVVVAAVLLGPFAPVVWALVIVDFFGRYDDGRARSLLLRQIAGTLVVIPASVFVFFLVGETMTDPGGLDGVVLIVLWSLPIAALAGVIHTWPRFAAYLVGFLSTGLVAMDIWYASNARVWRSFEDAHGPVAAAISFSVVTVMALVAWRRPALVGGLMLTVSVVAMGLAMFVDELKPAAVATVVVGLVPGMLFVVSAALSRGSVSLPRVWNDVSSARAGDGDDSEFRCDCGQCGRDTIRTTGAQGSSGPK